MTHAITNESEILIVDDEASLRDMLGIVFKEDGWAVRTAGSLAEARRELDSREPDIILCDLMMPDGSGIEFLQHVKERNDRIPVIMITAYTSTESAVVALKAGALDYIAKPFDNEELKIIVSKAVERRDLEVENVYLRRALEDKYTFTNIIGKSRTMQEIFGIVTRIAPTNSTVLVTGESGTGKELIAQAIHVHSGRPGRFVSINCGALPETLLESELFGHERGAFTGATRDKRGLFQEANKGTIFLDEIGEMSPAMQIKVLRVLQDRVVRRVGGNEETLVDVRVIAATNQDLTEAIQKGTFREDLFYRINVIPIQLPPLRERKEDIPLLVDHFVTRNTQKLGLPPKRISVEAMEALENYTWPGNVRELENVVERVVALDPEETVTLRALPESVRVGVDLSGDVYDLPDDGIDLEAHLENIGKQFIVKALERTDGVQKSAAKLLGMSFRSFRYYAKKYGIVPRGKSKKRGTTSEKVSA